MEIWALYGTLNYRENVRYGGQEGIRTLETVQPAYSLSRGAPSATRPPARRACNPLGLSFARDFWLMVVN